MNQPRTLQDYPLDELKLLYRILHAQIPAQPQIMDLELLQDLQTHLQNQARAAGIDVSLHAQWAAWLGSPPLRGL